MKKTVQTLLATTVLSFGLSSVALADDDIHEIQQITQSFGLISLDEAKTKALAAKAGVVKDVDLENRKFNKGWDYEFEILDADGAEWEVYVDAKTGNVSNISRDWI